MPSSCWCGQTATHLVESDSIRFRDGQPVCEAHAEGRDPAETPVDLRSLFDGNRA